MIVLLDESGDLGWTFEHPYRQGGSSRYLTLAFMFLPKKHRNEPKNIIRSLYHQYGWKGEKKACDATLNQKTLFCEKVVELLKNNSEIKIDVITVKKEHVQDHIRSDANKLYNYMVGLVVPEYVKDYETIDFVPDERSVKVKSGNSLADHLKVKLWFDYGYKTNLVNLPATSDRNYNLQFVDWISNCVWVSFEDQLSQFYKTLLPFIKHRPLFF